MREITMNMGGGTSTVDLTDGTITITSERKVNVKLLFRLPFINAQSGFDVSIPSIDVEGSSIMNNEEQCYEFSVIRDIIESNYMLTTVTTSEQVKQCYIVARNRKVELLDTDTMETLMETSINHVGTTVFLIGVDSLMQY